MAAGAELRSLFFHQSYHSPLSVFLGVGAEGGRKSSLRSLFGGGAGGGGAWFFGLLSVTSVFLHGIFLIYRIWNLGI